MPFPGAPGRPTAAGTAPARCPSARCRAKRPRPPARRPTDAHVDLIRERLADSGFAAARVGTVDRFQGQEAVVSIYAMGSSSAEDAPRGMEFLYSLNRLNVATSRARCAAVVVASPELVR